MQQGSPALNIALILTCCGVLIDAEAEGLRFDRFYAAAAGCSPTRASVLTGRHPFRMRIDGANSGHLRNEEYSETTFSISNLGMYDVESFSAIIYPPHAAVLAVGTVKEQAVVRNGELAVAQMMKATLSTDHRVAAGAEAARFLVEIKEILEPPVALLL